MTLEEYEAQRKEKRAQMKAERQAAANGSAVSTEQFKGMAKVEKPQEEDLFDVAIKGPRGPRMRNKEVSTVHVLYHFKLYYTCYSAQFIAYFLF